MKACVTGAAGFIGHNLCMYLLEAGWDVVGLDNYSTGKNKRDYIYPIDIVYPSKRHLFEVMVEKLQGCDVVFHLAANADVRHGLEHPQKDIYQNIIGTQFMLQAAVDAGIKKFMLASTGSVYGNQNVYPTPEDAPMPIQTSLYSTSKVAAEGLLTSYAQAYDLKAYIFRFAGVLGEGYTHGHVIDFYNQLIEKPKKITILGNGLTEKSYIDVSDLINGIWYGMQADQKVNIFNVGREETITVLESLSTICGCLNVYPEVVTGTGAGWPGDNPTICLDTSRLRRMGWWPRMTIKDAIINTVKFLELE